jgi:N-acetylglutamate synthase/N-acetylornithine aminotransferase
MLRAQGSGMIHPNMATMLGVVTSDAAVAPDAWRDMVRRASTASFNQITVSHMRTLLHACMHASQNQWGRWVD